MNRSEATYVPPTDEAIATMRAQAEEDDRIASEAMRKIGAAFRLLAAQNHGRMDAPRIFAEAADSAETIARIVDGAGE